MIQKGIIKKMASEEFKESCRTFDRIQKGIIHSLSRYSDLGG